LPTLGSKFFPVAIYLIINNCQYLRQNKISSDMEKSSPSATTEIKPLEKRKRGRPKGSKNKDKTEVILTSELLSNRIELGSKKLSEPPPICLHNLLPIDCMQYDKCQKAIGQPKM
jgi:hypothetical protein